MKKIYKISILMLLVILIMGICIFAIRVYKTNNNKNVIEIDSSNKNYSNLDVKNENNIQENKYSKNIILFKGMEISNKIGLQDVTDMKKNSEKDYNTKYYNYENGKFLNESNGLKEDTYEGQFIISNVKKIAMTKKYNATPREFKTIKSIPNELIDMLDYSSVEINEIDLDGDNKKEHIICYTFDTSNADYEDGEMQALSGIMLMDENYKKIADLVTLDNGFWGNIKSEENKIFLSLKDVEYIDLDEDGIMEIIIEIPTYEGTKISVLKYEKGVLSGEKDVKASVIP